MKWLLLVAAIATAAQIPILPFASDVSYKSVDASQHPIDLTQYEDSSVLRVEASDKAELLRFLKKHNISIWKSTQDYVDVQVNPTTLSQLSSQGYVTSATTQIQNLAQAVFETFPKKEEKLDIQSLSDDIHSLTEIFFKQYRLLDTINAWIQLLQETYPEVLLVEDIGETYEGRPLRVVHLSVQDDSVDHQDKKTVVVSGGVHAREWISVLTVLYSIYGMLRHYEENPHDSKTLAKLDFLFFPVLNPDGYEYSWTTDRLWRKNRQGTSSSKCFGIDIDHTFDYHWTRSLDSPCGEEYSGEGPFEALELRAWRNYLNKTNHEHKIYGYVDIHSYGQEILYPYAYSCKDVPKDQENLIELAFGISKAIRLSSGKYYAVSPACIDRDSDLLPDLGAGTALDYMYHQHAYWAYQLKLRDGGSHGFLLPDKYIIPVGEETVEGFKYFCKFILSDEH